MSRSRFRRDHRILILTILLLSFLVGASRAQQPYDRPIDLPTGISPDSTVVVRIYLQNGSGTATTGWGSLDISLPDTTVAVMGVVGDSGDWDSPPVLVSVGSDALHREGYTITTTDPLITAGAAGWDRYQSRWIDVSFTAQTIGSFGVYYRRSVDEVIAPTTSVRVDQQGWPVHLAVAEVAPATPEDQIVDLPETIALGASAVVRVWLRNGSVTPTTGSGELSISMPDTAIVAMEIASDSGDWDSPPTLYPAGSTVYDRGENPMVSLHPLISAEALGWDAGQVRWVDVRFTARSTGAFDVYYRRAINGNLAPETSDYTDQQGWPVRRESCGVVLRFPDLYAEPPSPSAGVLSAGESFGIVLRVVNAGDAEAGYSIAAIYLGAGPGDLDTYLGSTLVSPIPPNYWVTEFTSARVPDATPGGDYYLSVYVDSFDEVNEMIESNNVATVPIAILNPDTEIHYELDGNAQDSSGNDWHATARNVQWVPDRTGREDGAARFAGGTGSYLDIGQAGKNPLPVTAAVYCRVDSLGPIQTIVATDLSDGNCSYNGIQIFILDDGRLRVLIGSGGVASVWTRHSCTTHVPVITARRWHHVACVIKARNDIDLYVDGAEIESKAYGGEGPGVPAYTSSPGRVGAAMDCADSSGEGLSGLLDDFRFYRRALTESEILELYVPSNSFAFPAVSVGDSIGAVFEVANMRAYDFVVDAVDLAHDGVRYSGELPITIPAEGSFGMEFEYVPSTDEMLQIPGKLRSATGDSQALYLDVEAWPLAATVSTASPAGYYDQAMEVNITPKGAARIQSGVVKYRGIGAPDFAETNLFLEDGLWKAIIPGADVIPPEMVYYAELHNDEFVGYAPGASPDSLASFFVGVPLGARVNALPNSGSGYLARKDVTVEVSLWNNSDFISGTLFYRRGGESTYQSTSLGWEGFSPRAVIPGAFVGVRGVEYYARIKTRDETITLPWGAADGQYLTIAVSIPDLVDPYVAEGGRYRMVSIPLEFDRGITWESLLADQEEFRAYDPVRWRCFRWDPEAVAYAEFDPAENTALFELSPGKGFWLICADSSQVRTGPATANSTPTNEPFRVRLEQGWNQIGTPYSFPVDWESVTVDGVPVGTFGTAIEGPFAFDPETGSYEDNYVRVLEPFAGYWVFNGTVPSPSQPLVLEIPPNESATQVAARSGDIADHTAWSIRFTAGTEGASSQSVRCGVHAEALDSRDARDRSAPPASPRPGIRIHSLPGDGGRPLACDIRSMARLQTWRLDVEVAGIDPTREIVLNWSGTEDLNPEDGAVLVDLRLERVVDMREAGSYRFVGNPTSSAPRFEVHVGNPDDLMGRIDATAAVPATSRILGCRPNPFNPATVIEYETSIGDVVTVAVYDVRGGLIATLPVEVQSGGRHEAVWNGTDTGGRRVSSGVYFVRLASASGVSDVRKVVMTK